MTKMQGCPIDRRKLHRLHRKMREAIRRAEERVNARIIERMKELAADVEVMEEIAEEIKEIKSEEDARVYIENITARVSNEKENM